MSTLVVRRSGGADSKMDHQQDAWQKHVSWLAPRPRVTDSEMAPPSCACLTKAVGVQGCGRNDHRDLPIEPGPYRVQSSTWSKLSELCRGNVDFERSSDCFRRSELPRAGTLEKALLMLLRDRMSKISMICRSIITKINTQLRL